MAELVDAHDSKSCVFGRVGSIPTLGTTRNTAIIAVHLTKKTVYTETIGIPVVFVLGAVMTNLPVN